MTRDFSAAMLALFLEARIVARRRIHGDSPARARAHVAGIVRRDGGLSRDEFKKALAGRLSSPAARRRAFEALGVAKAESGEQAQCG